MKKGLSIFILYVMLAAGAFAQTDTSSAVADTASAGINQRQQKGEKISGTVRDGNTGKTLSGVNVSVAGFSAAITDERGKFSITIPNRKTTVSVSITGYHTKLFPSRNTGPVSVTLFPLDFPSLYGMVNTPSGTQSASRSVAAVSYISAQDITTIKSETADSYYQGRLSGLNSIRRSGTPGIGADLFIRGFNSLQATNRPLYIVDGVIYDTESYGTSIINGHINNALGRIDPRDIANVTVIKDAVGAAAYGTRAANGVVLINTARATSLDTRIEFTAQGGINTTPDRIPLLSATDYRTYLSDVLKTRGLTAAGAATLPYFNSAQATNPQYYNYYNSTDWQKEVFKTSVNQNYFLNVSGGDNIAKYVLSAGFLQDKGVIDSTRSIRYNTRFNADLDLSNRLSGNVSLAFTYAEQQLKDQGISPTTNPIFAALIKSPFLTTNQVNATGEVSPNLADVDVFGATNPRVLIEDGNNATKGYRFSGSAKFSYTLNKSLLLSNITGITYDKNQESLFIPRLGVANDTLFNVIADSRLASQVLRYFSLSNDARLSFSRQFAYKHHINASAGVRYTSNDSEQDFGEGYNSGTDELKSVGNSQASTRLLGGGIGKWRSVNSFLTADYAYADKYLVSASLAADASSRFGSEVKNAPAIGGNRLALLPAVGVAWVMSSEPFMSSSRAVDLLKIRASYGLTGNDDIGNYTAKRYYVSQNFLGTQGLVRGNIANPYLQWEVVKKANAGIDAAFLNERISISADLWKNKTDKMITSQAVSGLTGFDSYISNNASMETKGFDLSLNVRLLAAAVKWDAGITLGRYSNKVTALAAGTSYTTFAGATYLTTVGEVANSFYGHTTRGVYATDADAAAAGLSIRLTSGKLVPFQAGDIRFNDLNNDKVIDDKDRSILGNPNPDYYGGFTNRVSYKRFALSALVTFVTGNEVYNYTRSQLESQSNLYNQSVASLNRWRGQGQVTVVPRAVNGDPLGNSRFSDRWIEDGSYVRVRTVALSYAVPVRSGALKFVNVFCNANNLFTWSNYLGYDPEFSAAPGVFTQGVDTTLEPQFKTFQLGFKIGL